MPEPNFKQFWNLAPDENSPEVLNMYVYGEIMDQQGWFGDESDVVTSRFLKDLKQYPDVKTINVYINSPGGGVFAAAAIRNQLRQHKAIVHTWGEGLIASAAVGLMGAADPGCRHMSNSALLMIHNPSTRTVGDASAMMKAAEVLDKVKNTLLNMYVEDTGSDRDVLSKLMDECTYMEASEAQKYGFIDTVTEEDSDVTIKDDDTFIFNGVSCAFSNYANPSELKARLTHLAKLNNKGGKVNMTFEDFLNSLSADHQTLVRNHISTVLNNANAQAVQDKAVWDAEKASLEGELSTAKADLATTQAELDKFKNAGADPDETFLNSLPEEARKAVIAARQAEAEAKAQIQSMAEEKAFNAFKDTLSAYDALPIQDEHIKSLYKASQADPEGYKALTDLLQVANQAMNAGFTPVGNTGVPTATTAYDEIEQRVSALRAKDTTLSYNDAFNKVVKDDPDLYNRYRAE